MSATVEDLKRRIQKAGSSAAALRERIARATEPDAATADAAFASSAKTRLANNILAAPSATGDLLAAASAGVSGTAALLAGKSPEYLRRFGEEQGKFPASALRGIPRPKIQDLAAGMRTIPALVPGGETPGEAFARHRADIAAEERTLLEEHPVASFVGSIAGDAASLAAGRAPAARAAVRGNLRWAGWSEGLQRGAARGAEQVERIRDLPPGVLKQLDTIWSSKAVSALKRGAGRTAETGFESAALAAVNSDDPMESALWGAAYQAGGSASLATIKGILGTKLGLGLGLAAAAVSTGSILEVLEQAAPGESDGIIKNINQGYSKVLLAILGGTLAGLPTTRVKGSLRENLPILADALTSVPRGAVLSAINDLTADGESAKAGRRILDQIRTDPSVFSKEQLSELERAFNDGKFSDAVGRMARKDEKFRAVAAGEKPTYRTGGRF